MCTALIALGVDKEYPLIVLHNRDELTDRKCLPITRHQESMAIYGVDLTEQGTWLGMNQDRGFALLTNYRDPQNRRSNARSRGILVKRLLDERMSVDQATDFLLSNAHHHNPFNLIFGNMSEVFCFSSNHHDVEAIPKGIHGICNADLNTPWPKLVRAKGLLQSVLTQVWTDSDLLAIMTDKERPPVKDLPKTGLPLDQEVLVSSIFIEHPQYQTRSTTLIKFDKLGNSMIREITYKNGLAILDESLSG